MFDDLKPPFQMRAHVQHGGEYLVATSEARQVECLVTL
jgi:hypothetical protein